MTSAFIEHLKKQPSATVINVSSGLAFTPLAVTAVYCATESGITLLDAFAALPAERQFGDGSRVGSSVGADRAVGRQKRSSGNAAQKVYCRSHDRSRNGRWRESLVEGVKGCVINAGPNEGAFVTQFNDRLAQSLH